MVIYFEDGVLRDINQLRLKPDFVINASEGISNNINLLDYIKKDYPNSVVYTNSIFALNNRYVWNEALKAPTILIRDKNDVFTRIDKMTNRELREGHNLAKLFVSGEFEDIEEERG